MAAGNAPADQPGLQELRSYLSTEQAKQPLQNRLMLLWASTKMPDLLSSSERKKLLDEVFGLQQADGGWTLDSLGPWKPHAAAIPSIGSDSYATAFTAFIVQESGLPSADPRVARALDWLRSHQNRESGAWAAHSMNKQYKDGSMEQRFVQDTATAFAAMALVKAESGSLEGKSLEGKR